MRESLNNVHFSHRILDTPTPIENPKTWQLNLSSNEMGHDACLKLAAQFFQLVKPECLRSYPRYTAVSRLAAESAGLRVEQVLLSAGSDDGIRMIIGSLAATQQRMILQSPNYENYTIFGRHFGCAITVIPTVPGNPESFLKELGRAIDRTPPALVVLTNPNGFSGHAYSIEILREIAYRCDAAGHLLLIDEAYSAYVPMSHAPLLMEFSSVILVRSFSKALGMAGLRLGLVASGAHIIDYLSRWQIVNAVSGIALEFFEFCLANWKILEKARGEIMEVRSELSAAVSKLLPGWYSYPTAANFILLEAPDITTAADLVSYLASRAIRSRHLAGVMGYDRCVRMTVWQRSTMIAVSEALEKYTSEV